jgi:signal transduction histidine kinase
MNKKNFRWIITLMSIALLGIITLQVYWITHDIQLKEQQFEQTVNQAMNAIVDRIETNEAMNMLHERIFDIDPAKISRMMIQDTTPLEPQLITDTIFEVPSVAFLPPSPFWSDLDNADINIEFHTPGSKHSFLRVQRRNYFHQDSLSKHTIRSSQIMRFYGDSAEVTIRQNEEKIKARMEKLNDVMQKMAIEFAKPEDNVRKRVNADKLDTIIRQELLKRGIDLNYEFGVWKGDSSNLIFSNAAVIPDDFLNSKFKILLFPNDIVSKPDFLLLNFPGSINYVLASIWVMLAGSVIFTLIIVLSFAYTIHVIIKQKKLSDIKSDFINNMTHEFKTPIATISLAVDSINDPRVSTNTEKLNYFSKIIKEENKRMNAQVENVLQMAQMDKGEFSINKESVNLHEVIQRAVELTSLQVESRNGKIHQELHAQMPMITGDKIHLSNVIFNLLDNANKYSPENPAISISTENNDSGIIVKVRDEGIGMTKETQKRIFEKFFRVATGNIHDIKGFGLGLSYVKAVIDLHHGWILVESEPDHGSTFELFLPFK